MSIAAAHQVGLSGMECRSLVLSVIHDPLPGRLRAGDLQVAVSLCFVAVHGDQHSAATIRPRELDGLRMADVYLLLFVYWGFRARRLQGSLCAHNRGLS